MKKGYNCIALVKKGTLSFYMVLVWILLQNTAEKRDFLMFSHTLLCISVTHEKERVKWSAAVNKTLPIHELGYPAYWYKITILGAKHPIIPCNIEKQITNMQCRRQSREQRTKYIMNMNIFLGVHISHSSSYRMLISTFMG